MPFNFVLNLNNWKGFRATHNMDAVVEMIRSSPLHTSSNNSHSHISAIHSVHGNETDHASYPRSNKSAPTRRSPIKTTPNLLHRSMLKKAVKKGVLPNDERKKVCYSSPGHHCWSSLRIKEWQEFQRIINDENFNREGHLSNNSYLYFAHSPHPASRASKRTIRRQMATPDSDYYNKSRANDFIQIEKAIGSIQFTKNQKRQDFLSGVPSEFFAQSDKSNSGTDVNNNDGGDNYDNKTHLRFATPPKQETEHTGQITRAASSRPSIPGSYVFPKASDFVPLEGTKLQPVGVDWKYSQCHRSQSAQVTSGKLLHNCRPVTDGLNRQGTSVSKIQGKPLGQGEWNVKKVWNRKNVGHNINTLQMARNDISSDYIKNNMKKAKRTIEASRERDEDTMSMEAQSINRADSDAEEHSVLSD